jgi:YVTN family beta-propeller protein
MNLAQKRSRCVKFVLTLGAVLLATGCRDPQSIATGLSARAKHGTEAYVCNFGFDDQPGTTIAPVATATGRVGRSVTTGSLPSALAATPDGRFLLVTDEGDDHLVVLDTTTDDVVARFPTGVEPDAVGVSPDGDIALVANVDDNTVTPVDLSTRREGRAIAVGARPDAIAIGGPGGLTAIVADLEGNTVTPVDLGTMTAGAPIAVGTEPDAVAVSPDGTEALVANFGSGTVTPIDLTTLHAGRAVAVGPGPTSLAVSATGPSGVPTAWVTTGETLVPVNLASFTVGSPLSLGHVAEAVAIAPDGTTAWVAAEDATVIPVDLSTGRPAHAIFVGGRPSAIVIPPPRH